MKKTRTRILALAIILPMLAALSLTSFAADVDTQPLISPAPAAPAAMALQLDGQTKADVSMYIKDGRTLVALRGFFESMDATVAFDEATRSATVKRDETTIVLTAGSTDISVTKDGKTEVTKTDVAPEIDADGNMMLPMRAVASLLGATIGWDAATRTAIVIDLPTMLEEFAGKFTILEKLAAMQPAVEADKISLTEVDMTMAIDVTDPEAGKISIPATFDMDILSKGLVGDGKANVSIDLSELPESQQIPGMTAKLDMKMDVIANMETGVLYYQYPFMNAMLEVDEAAWLSLDLAAMLKQLGFEYEELMATNEMDVAAIIDLIKAQLPTELTLTPESYGEIKATLDALENMSGDKAFTKSGDTYKNVIDLTDELGAPCKITLEVTLDGDKAKSVALNVNVSDEVGAMNIDMKTDAANVTMKMTLDVEDTVSMVLDLTAKQSESTTAPRTAPPADAVFVDMMTYLTGLVPTI